MPLHLSFKAHLESCLLKVVSCTNAICNETMTRNNLQAHVTTTCPWRILQCNHCGVSHPACETEVNIFILSQDHSKRIWIFLGNRPGLVTLVQLLGPGLKQMQNLHTWRFFVNPPANFSMVGYIHLQRTAIAVEFARFGFLSKTIKNSIDHCDGYTRTFKPVLSAHSQTKTKTNKQTNKKNSRFI